MPSATLTPEVQAIIAGLGAIGGWDEGFGQVNERAFSDYVTAANTAVDGLRPTYVEQRAAWQRQDTTRDVASYPADAFATAMVTLAQSAGRKLTLADGSQARARFDMLVALCQHEHSDKAVDKFRGYVTGTPAAGLDWDQYIEWLPTAGRYTPSGKLTAAAIESDRVAAEEAEQAKAESDAAKVTRRANRAAVRLTGTTDFSLVTPGVTEERAKLTQEMRFHADLGAHIEEELAKLTPAEAKALRDQITSEVSAAVRAAAKAALAAAKATVEA